MPATVRRFRLPALALAVGSAAGVVLFALLGVFRQYVGGVAGIVEALTAVSTGGPALALALAAAFLVGLSMNFLPCNLPVVLSLLPATTGEATRGAFARKTGLYAAGALAVLATLGAVLGAFGAAIRPLLLGPTVRATVAVAIIGGVGALSVLWGLREFDLVALPALAFPFGDALRGAVDDREGATEYLLLGAVYGGTGGGCPLPTYHLLLLWVVAVGSPLYGAAVLGTYVLGRVLPVAVVGAALRERPGRVADLFGGRYGTLRTVNGAVLVAGGSLLVVFTGLRAAAVAI